MKNNNIIRQISQQGKENVKEEIKIGKTMYIVNQVFAPKQSKQEAWLAIITRAKSLKTDR